MTKQKIRMLTSEDHPSHVYVSDESCAHKAYAACNEALLSGQFNAAVWNYPALSVSDAIRAEAAKFAAFFDQHHLDEPEFYLDGYAPLNTALTDYAGGFKDHIKAICAKSRMDMDGIYPEKLVSYLQDIYTPMHKAFNDAVIAPSLMVDTLNWTRLNAHIDHRFTHEKDLDAWLQKPRLNLAVLSTFTGGGTLILKNEDFKAYRFKTHANGWVDWSSDVRAVHDAPSLWQVQNFAVAMLTSSPLPHMPVVHSWPIKDGAAHTPRLKFHASLNFNAS